MHKREKHKPKEAIDPPCKAIRLAGDPLYISYTSYASYSAKEIFRSKGVSEEELALLREELHVIYPWNKGYDTARQVVNQRRVAFPLLIVQPRSVREVVKALRWAKKHNIQLTLKSGGHSYEGFSVCAGMVIDQSKRTRIAVNKCRITVESGVLLGPLAAELSQRHLAIPAGSCANVAVAGLTLGGGIGLLQRKYGLTLDNLKEIEMVTAGGQVVRANRKEHPDLFWASRGGGGGNFGIVTSFTFRAHHVDSVILFQLHWPFSHFSQIFPIWQDWAPHTDDRLSSEANLYGPEAPRARGCHHQHDGLGQPIFEVSGEFLGDEKELRRLLSPLLSTPDVESQIWQCSYLDAVKHFTGKTVRPPFFKNRSDFALQPLPLSALQRIEEFMRKGNRLNRLEFAAMGGKVASVDNCATAFAHRHALFWMQYGAAWEHQEEERDKVKWINDFYQAMRPYFPGSSYVNCPDVELGTNDTEQPDYRYLYAYYGENLDKLLAIKRKWDPENIFHFPQSIPTSL